MNKDKRFGISQHIQIATWNVRGLTDKIHELQNELSDRKIDIAVITETKKKMQGTIDLEKYTMIYGGVPMEQRASAGVAVLVNSIWKKKIHSYTWYSERIIVLKFKIDRGYLSIIGVYAPEDGRKTESEKFYQQLQYVIGKCNKNVYIALVGDLNARRGNVPITNIVGFNGEPIINQNGEILRDFTCFNNLRIMNSKQDGLKVVTRKNPWRNVGKLIC